MPCAGKSPPTRDPGLMMVEKGKQGPLSHEIHKLQNELEVCIQKVEELASRGNPWKQLITVYFKYTSKHCCSMICCYFSLQSPLWVVLLLIRTIL